MKPGALAYIDVTWSLSRVLDTASATAEQRWVPLCDGGIHHVIGAVSPRDVVRAVVSGAALKGRALPVLYAPYTRPPHDALAMAEDADPYRRCPLVVFVDEYGSTVATVERDI